MTRIALLLLAACAGTPHGSRADEGEGRGPENTVPDSALPLADCDDVTRVLTLDDLAAGTGDGERIAIDLVPRAKQECTEKECFDTACCNACEGEYFARLERSPASPDLELHLTGPLLAGCSGMDCNFHCEPFGRKPTTAYRFIGRNTFRPAGTSSLYHQAFLDVEKFCRL